MPREIQNLAIYNVIDILENHQTLCKTKYHELSLIKLNLNVTETEINIDLANLEKDIQDCFKTVELFYSLIKAKSDNDDELILQKVKEYMLK